MLATQSSRLPDYQSEVPYTMAYTIRRHLLATMHQLQLQDAPMSKHDTSSNNHSSRGPTWQLCNKVQHSSMQTCVTAIRKSCCSSRVCSAKQQDTAQPPDCQCHAQSSCPQCTMHVQAAVLQQCQQGRSATIMCSMVITEVCSIG